MARHSVEITADKPGRRVTVASGPDALEALFGAPRGETATSGQITLEIGGRGGESEWTFLTPSEAREIAAALEKAAVEADAEAGT
jgi:hypothetical protein